MRPDSKRNKKNQGQGGDDRTNTIDPLFLQRFSIDQEIRFDNEQALTSSSSSSSRGDDGIGSNNPATQVLGVMGDLLEHTEHALEDLSQNDMLGTAIVRSCQGIADAVGSLAGELERHSEEDRRALAEACLEDMQEMQQRQRHQHQMIATTQQQQQQQQLALQEVTSDDIVSALSGCSTLLRDVEAGLRGIEQDEADEIADVALTLARLFLASLQSFHASVVDKEAQQRQVVESDCIELLDDDDDEDIDGDNTRNDKGTNKTRQKHTTKEQQQRQLREQRLRVLWPPIGPTVQKACQWGKDEAVKQPLLAVALGITLWPAAVMTAFLGAPVVLADSVLQHTYNTFQEGPIVKYLEQGAAQVFQAGKLSLLTGKLVGRQSLRILNRQIERNGGVGNIAHNAMGMAVDRAMHPVETIGAVWEGLQWGWHQVQENIEAMNDPERQDAVSAMMENRPFLF